MEWDYSILDRSGYSIARVSKELFHMTDTYVIDVQNPGNEKNIWPRTYETSYSCKHCTGEEVAGFKDIRTGKFEEIMLIRSPEDLERFKEIYEITEKIIKEY